MKKCWNFGIGKLTARVWMTFIAFFRIWPIRRPVEIDIIRCQSHCVLVIVPKEVVE